METPLKKAIVAGQPFVIYRLPGQKEVNIIIQNVTELSFHRFDEIDSLKGFFVAPFRGKRINELICLKPDHVFSFIPIKSSLLT